MVERAAPPLVPEVGRVPSMRVPLDRAGETRFARLMESLVMVDLHQHPLVLPAQPAHFRDYLAHGPYRWGYAAARAGGWTAVGTANFFRGAARVTEPSFLRFDDLVAEVAAMNADLAHQKAAGTGVVRATTVAAIGTARTAGAVAFIPTVEYVAIGNDIDRLETLYGLGVRLGGLTYMRRNPSGDGQYDRTDGGLSEFGIEAVRRMNDLGMAVDLSHASGRTALDAIEHSGAPVVFSHNAAHALRPTRRTRHDEELRACARRGGIIGVTAVPNSLSDDPRQTIDCVLDHYDYLVRLVGVDHVAIGTDTLIGDHVAYHREMMASAGPFPAPYLDGLESPADGSNIVRGLIARGYPDSAIRRIAGENALRFFGEVWR